MNKKHLISSFNLVNKFFNYDESKTIEWFNTNNVLLGGYTPMGILGMGRGQKLLSFIKDSLEENIK